MFAAPWFAAIYLLLFVSLVGCLVPRIRLHARALRTKPPALRAPGAAARGYSSYMTEASPEDVLAKAKPLLRGWRVASAAAAWRPSARLLPRSATRQPRNSGSADSSTSAGEPAAVYVV